MTHMKIFNGGDLVEKKLIQDIGILTNSQLKYTFDYIENENNIKKSELLTKISKETNKIGSITEWNNFRRVNKKLIIPFHPERIYKDFWEGWKDFLSKE